MMACMHHTVPHVNADGLRRINFALYMVTANGVALCCEATFVHSICAYLCAVHAIRNLPARLVTEAIDRHCRNSSPLVWLRLQRVPPSVRASPAS